MDMLADPQSKVLSPLLIFDVLFPAPYANLISLVFLSMVGGLGMILLLRHLEISYPISLLIAFLYMHSSWFSLHFSEGHIIFGSFQLASLVLYFTLKIYESRYKVYLAALLAFMLLDGGMYAFIYNSLLVLFTLLFKFHGLSIVALIKNSVTNWKSTLIAIFIFCGLAAGKIVPLLTVHAHRNPISENIFLDFQSLLVAFFYPFQYILLESPGASYLDQRLGFHEIGAYIGIVSFIITAVFLVKRWNKKYLPILGLCLFFFWIGSGIGGEYNPWTLFQQIPVVNNAHVQTRALFIPWLMLVILLAYALQFIATTIDKMVFNVIILFLITEAVVVSNYSYWKIYQHEGSSAQSEMFNGLLHNTRIDKTMFSYSTWGRHYKLFELENTASKTFMNPAVNQGKIRTIEDEDYRGEVYFIAGKGKVEMESYTPNSLVLTINSPSYSEIQVNTNYITKWQSDNKDVQVLEQDGLLTLKTNGFVGLLSLKYRPQYLIPVISLYILSILLLVIYAYIQRVVKRLKST